MKNTKRFLAIIMAIVMALSFAVPAMAFETEDDYVPIIVPEEGLPIQPLFWPAPTIDVTIAGTSTRPPDGLSHHISWEWLGEDPTEFVVYIFDTPTETIFSNAVRTIVLPGSARHLNIPVFGSRGNMPFTPLPHGEYFVRVRGRAPFPIGDSMISEATPPLQFGRRVTTLQQTPVLIEHRAQFPDAGFIIIDIRDGLGTLHTTETQIFPGAIRIPFGNQDADVNVDGNPANYHLLNQRFLERVQHELKAHPNYNGPDTLIFMH